MTAATARGVPTGAKFVAPSVAVALAVALALSGCASVDASANPFSGYELFVPSDTQAAAAANDGTTTAERDAAAVLAAQPTAIWLLPERFGTGEVGERVRGVLAEASDQQRFDLPTAPVFVIYGITDRDCGNQNSTQTSGQTSDQNTTQNGGQSAGGLPRAEYLDWVDEIADALGDSRAAVVLEPDALALARECADPDARIELVADAAARLTAARNTAVYLDGGHSAWLPVDEMAAILESAGVDRVRGFATNVSNTQSTAAETAYAEALSTAVGGAHAVIDVSRNGNGPPADGSWCNAPGRAIGVSPHSLAGNVTAAAGTTTAATADTAPADMTTLDTPATPVDALLWVKAPGESDGECNGGPPAGEWWPAGAIELVENAEHRTTSGEG